MYKILLVDEEEQVLDSLESLMEKLERVVPVIENGLIYNLLFQEYFTEDILYYKNFLTIKEDYGYMLAIVWGDVQEGSHMTNALGSSIRMQQYYTGIRTCIREQFHGIVGNVMSNKIAVLIPYAREVMEEEERLEVLEQARSLIRRMKKQAGVSFRIGIGGIREFEGLRDSYQEALEALVHSVEIVSHIEDLPRYLESEEDYPLHMEKKLFEEVERGCRNEVRAIAGAFFDWMTRSYPNRLMDIRQKVLELVLWAEHIAVEKTKPSGRFLEREDYLSLLMEMTEPAVLRSWFLWRLGDICGRIADRRKEKEGSLIEAAREYIAKNYRKDLSLEEVSRRVNVSPYYFSRIFKEGTGQNFVEYLTMIRMEKAKELLTESHCSMKEISSQVGYSEPNYFSRSFRKNVGVSPTEYKTAYVTHALPDPPSGSTEPLPAAADSEPVSG